MAAILPMTGELSYVMSCAKISYTINYDEMTLARYPSCESYFSGRNPEQYAVVRATLTGAGDPAEAGAILNLCFGAAMWLAFIIHAFAVEVYVSSQVSS